MTQNFAPLYLIEDSGGLCTVLYLIPVPVPAPAPAPAPAPPPSYMPALGTDQKSGRKPRRHLIGGHQQRGMFRNVWDNRDMEAVKI